MNVTNEDISILLSACIMGISFLGFHIAFFHLYKPRSMMHALKLLLVSYICSVIVGSILLFAFQSSTSIDITIFVFIVYIVLTVLLFASYVMGIFILFDSSIRFKYILTIAAYGEKGIDKKKLTAILGMKTLITNRVERLIEAGVIESTNGRMVIKNERSLVVIREKLVGWTMKIYQ